MCQGRATEQRDEGSGNLEALRERVARLEETNAHLVERIDAMTGGEALLEVLLESVDRAVLVVDVDSLLIVDCNAPTENMFGYSREELLGRDAASLHVDLKRFEEFRARAYAANELEGQSKTEFRMRRKNGEVFPTEHSVKRIAGPIDRPNRVVSVIRDVSDRKRSERLRDLFFSQSLDGCFFMMLDEPVRWDDSVDKEKALDYVFAHQRITQVNDAMTAQYGSDPEHFIGLTPADFYAHDPAQGRAVWRKFFDSGRLRQETLERKVDGAAIHIEGDYICLYDEAGLITGHFGVQRDVTDRKNAEEALRRSEEKYRTFFNGVREPAFLIRAEDDRIVEANDRCLEVLGYDVGELTAMTIWDLHPEEEQERARELQRQAGDAGSFHGADDVHYLRKDGVVIPVSVTTTILSIEESPMALVFFQDIGERKRTLEALRESEERLRAFFNNTNIGVAVATAEGKFIEVNRHYLKMFGYENREALFRRGVSNATHPDDREKTRKAHRALVRGEVDFIRTEVRLLRQDGSVFWGDMSIAPILEPGGSTRSFIAVITNITKRMEAEQALRQSEERLRSLFEGIDDALFVHDEKGRILDCNDAACRRLGYTREEFVGMRTKDIDAPEFARGFRERLEWQIKSGRYSCEGVHVAKDGRRIPIDVNTSVIEFHGKRAVLAVVRDITARKRVEAKLAFERDLFRSFVDHAPCLIYFKDKKGRFVEVNQAVAKAFGLERDALIGKSDADLYPKEQAKKRLNDEKEVMRRKTPLRKEEQADTPEGKKWFYTAKAPRFDEKGKVVGTFGFSWDITDRKEAEEQLQQYAATQAVLLREVNHRVKNNLLAIVSMLHKEEDRALAEGNKEALPALRNVERRVAGLSMVHTLLTESGWRPLVLTHLCQEIVSAAVGGAASSATIRYRVARSPARVTSNQAHHLTLVLNELATNTLKHALDRDGSVHIDVAIEEEGRDVVLVYRDTGPGYPDRVAEGVSPGASIGVGLVRGIVTQSLGGTIEFKNDRGAMAIIRFENEAESERNERS